MNAITPLTSMPDHSSHVVSRTPFATSQSRMDAAIARLRDGAAKFARLSLSQRIALVDVLQQGCLRVADRAVRAGCEAKGILMGTPMEAEEWASGVWGVVRQLRLIRESLHALAKSGNTPIGPVSRTADGRLAVRVFPGNGVDRMLFKDHFVDVHMQPGVTPEFLEQRRAGFYKQPAHEGRVVLVLGAGNIAAIPFMDVLTVMFNQGKACLLKMNPVNAYLGPFLEEAFAEAIRRDYLAVVYGGAEEGRYLVYHKNIDDVHITGSERTYDDIVWGPAGPAREERKRRNEPLLKKAITSELGNISPVIVVPGPYSEKELRFQAEETASYFVMNASFLCLAAKILVTPSGWHGSDLFLQGIKDVCAAVPPRQAYYPGAESRWRTLTAERPDVDMIGDASGGTLPWTFVTGLDPNAVDEPLYRQEAFCSLLAETRLGSADPIEFLERAVDFVNRKLWGTLTATLVVHPKSLRDPRVSAAVDRAIAALGYGTVAINSFTGLPFVFAAPPWGGHPGSTPDDIQSGSDFVHNTSMLEGMEKVVMRAPLTRFPKPAYFPSHKTSHRMMPRLVAMDANASWSKVPGIIFAAMRG